MKSLYLLWTRCYLHCSWKLILGCGLTWLCHRHRNISCVHADCWSFPISWLNMADYSAPCAEVMELRHSPIRWADVQLIAIWQTARPSRRGWWGSELWPEVPHWKSPLGCTGLDAQHAPCPAASRALAVLSGVTSRPVCGLALAPCPRRSLSPWRWRCVRGPSSWGEADTCEWDSRKPAGRSGAA